MCHEKELSVSASLPVHRMGDYHCVGDRLFCLSVFPRKRPRMKCVKSLREQSLVWATCITALLFIIATLTIYGIAYTYVPYLVFYVFLLIFIIRFKIELHRFNKGGEQ